MDSDVIIVGGGPAGLSTALHLVQKNPQWAERVLVLEKAVYPRPKLCGGGVTRPGLDILTGLGLSLTLPSVRVKEVFFRYRDLVYKLEGNPAFVVVARQAFDAWLAGEARKRGIVICEGVKALDVRADESGVTVFTTDGRLRARALVVADGSNSVVRRKLKWGAGRKALLLEVITPASENEDYLTRGAATFDWKVLDFGVEGYYWDFPTPSKNEAQQINRGVFHSRVYAHRPRPELRQALAQMLAIRGLNLDDYPLKGHPIHWFSPGDALARPRVLLAGDAAGADPLLGEGISFALGYGLVAADALSAAFASGDYSFIDYEDRVHRHWLLRQLRARRWGASIAFGVMRSGWMTRGLWRIAPWLFRIMARVRPDYFPLDDRRMLSAS